MKSSPVSPTLERSGLRERKKQRMREHIAQVARALFAARGFEAVTVAEVARVAEVAEQTVYNYFPRKEDLVYWRLESFEDELLATIRERATGESALAAFANFVRAPRGLLAKQDPGTREQLAALTRVITESPALLAREQQIFARYTAAFAALLAEEQGADPRDVEACVAANALMGVHRALVDFARRRIVEGARGPALRRDVLARADQALALLEDGLRGYAVRE